MDETKTTSADNPTTSWVKVTGFTDAGAAARAEEWRDIAFTLVGLLSRICDLVETDLDMKG